MKLTPERIKRNPMLAKFAEEVQCDACQGHFLPSKSKGHRIDDDATICPNCVPGVEKAEKKKMLYREVTNQELDKRVTKIEDGISDLTALVTTLVKSKQKKCKDCGAEFIPSSPAVKTCDACREDK